MNIIHYRSLRILTYTLVKYLVNEVLYKQYKLYMDNNYV